MGSLSALRRGSLATVVLVFGFLSFLLLGIVIIIDFILSESLFPYSLAVVAGFAFLFIFLQWLISPLIVRWAIREKQEVTPRSNAWLYSTVSDLAGQAGVAVPRIWVGSDDSPNAFVFGRTVNSSELVVTAGLLERLNADEVRAVLGHEIGHLRHRDVVVMTWVSAVPLLAYILARLGFEALRSSGRVRGRGAGQALLIAALVAIVSYAIYLVTQLLVLYLSRTREYYADAYGAAATRDPHLLASALTKIAYGLSLARRDSEPSGLRAFFIGDPVKAVDDYATLQDRMQRYDLDRDGQIDAYELQRAIQMERSHWSRANELFSTHPPTYKRILMLEEIEEEMKRGGLPADVYKFV